MAANKPTSVDDYMAQFPPDIPSILRQIRAVIRETAPEAEEKISYAMPGYFLNGGLVWFGAYKHHIGLYPLTEAMMQAIPELAAYKGTKGSVHFPLDQPVPYDLVRKIVQVRLVEMRGAD